MKRLVFHLSAIASVLLMSEGYAQAETVSPEAAKVKAIEFLTNGARKVSARRGMKQTLAVQNVELAYTSVKDDKTCFYVYNNGDDDGFVIVGGDDAAEEILAYSDNGHFDYDKAPDNFKELLSQYAEQISLAKPLADNSQNAPKHTARRTVAAPTVQKEDIPDLIQTTWDQWEPYNRAIPKLVNSNTGEEFTPPTGCVHTATAQVMKYWNYPEHGTGSISRTIDYAQEDPYYIGFGGSAPEFGAITHTIDYENSYYDWDNMLNSYTGQETEEQITAVSTLMYHVGVACYGIYGISETTGAYPEEGLKTYFGYSPKATALSRDQFDDETWDELIYGELALNRPILYSGGGEGYVGHEFIIHGYSAQNDMYKVNWGWGGWMDCYCKLTPTSGNTFLGYDNHQSAIVRLQPATMDLENSLDYGDVFWKDGFKYKVINGYYHTVEVIRPDENEPQYIGDISLPSEVNYLGVDYTVISIGFQAFVPYNIPDIYDKHPISNINSLPENLRIIREQGFAACYRIQNLVIPDNVSILGEYAFASWKRLENLTLPSNLKEIKRECFRYCESLERLVVPEGTEIIGGDAFAHCNKLNYVELPSTLDSLSASVFEGCSNMDVLICKAATPPVTNAYTTPFPNSVNNGYLLVPEASVDLYKVARYWKDWQSIVPIESTDLSKIGETDTINNIEYKIIPTGAEVKKVLYSSPTITIPDVINVNNLDYQVVSIGSNACGFSVNCDTIILPQYLTTIKSNAFHSCNARSISIPNSVTSIGNGAFHYCEKLERVNIPDSIENVMFDWFYGCNNLCTIELSQNVKQVFPSGGLINLYTLVCRSEEVPICNSDQIFAFSVEGTLYVPGGSVEQYQNAEGWKNWRFIKSIDEFDADEQLVIVTENGLQYRILNHGAVVLRPIEEKENLIIPESIEYKGQTYDVISIAEEAFRYGFYGSGNNFKSVHLPASMHSIMKYAFLNHTELNDINFSDNITYLGYGAFEGCTNLKDVVLPDSLKVMYEPFGGTAIEKLIIPEGTISIGDGLSFYRMENLKELVYPSTLELKWNYGIGFGELEDVYVLTPSFANVWSASGKRVYVPNEYVDACTNHEDWSVEEVLPIIPITSVMLNKSETTISSGENLTLAIEFSPQDASLKYVKWSSSDPTITSVNQDGIVTAQKAGTATIYARSMYYSDLIDSCIVTVTPSSHKIAYVLDGETYQTDNIAVGEAIVLPEEPAKAGYVFTGWEGLPKDSIMPNQDLELTAVFKKLGDPNDDGLINITDIVSVISYILEDAPESFIFKAADVNADGIINITDIVGIIDIILTDDAPANATLRRRVAALANALPSLTTLEIVPFGIEQGTTSATVTLDMLNPDDEFTAFECSIKLPEGIGWAYTTDRRGNIIYTQPTFNKAADRTDANYHTLSPVTKMSDGTFKVICYSMQKVEFLDAAGAILDLPLIFAEDLAEGIYEIEVKDIVLTRKDVTDVKPSDYKATVIVGKPDVKSATIYGDITANAIAMLNARLGVNESLSSLDLSSALAVDGSSAITTANPNAVIYVAEGMSAKNENNVIEGDVCANLVLTDGKPFGPAKTFTAMTAEYSRTLSADTYGTIVLPFTPDAETLKGYTFYELTDVETNALTFDEVSNPEAGKPYIVTSDGTATKMTAEAESAVAIEPASTEADGWTMTGTYESVVFTDADELANLYCISGNQFKQATSKLTMNPFRAYFVGDGSAKSIELRGDDGTTRIIDLTEDAKKGVLYDVLGRKVEMPAQGIYIHNGKKALVK